MIVRHLIAFADDQVEGQATPRPRATSTHARASASPARGRRQSKFIPEGNGSRLRASHDGAPLYWEGRLGSIGTCITTETFMVTHPFDLGAASNVVSLIHQ
jgi:hypothetical protein